MTDRWEHFQHQADMGVRGFGATKSEAFEQAALALTAVICPLDQVVPETGLEIHCTGVNDEVLLVAWLNRVIYEMAVRRMLFSRFDVCVMTPQLNARLWGESIDPDRHHPAVEVKAATYHELMVRQCPDGLWVAQCVVDV